MGLDTALLSTQHYKVRIKGKVEQSWEWSSALPQHPGVVAIEQGALESPATKVANFTYLYIHPTQRLGVYSRRPSSRINSQSISGHSKSGTRPLNLSYNFLGFSILTFLLFGSRQSQMAVMVAFLSLLLSASLGSLIVWYKVISQVRCYVNFSSLLYFRESCTRASQSIVLFHKVAYYPRLSLSQNVVLYQFSSLFYTLGSLVKGQNSKYHEACQSVCAGLWRGTKTLVFMYINQLREVVVGELLTISVCFPYLNFNN